MNILIDVVLPLALAFISFSLGLGLKFQDFHRIVQMPVAVCVGVVAQVLILPLIAYLLVSAFNLGGVTAFGVMLLAFCPGGVTSNMLTKFAGGAVALSITLTAVTLLMSFVTLPLWVSLASDRWLQDSGYDIDTFGIALGTFLITAVPVALGLALNRMRPALVQSIARPVSIIASVLFFLIVAAALASNWNVFITNFPSLGPVLITLNLVLLTVGFVVSRVFMMTAKDSIAVSIELGVQNATLGIAVAGMISGVEGIGTLALPAAIYGVLMYIVMLPLIAVIRRRG